ncbi:MAG: hypothetical protein WBW85_11505, partial [Terriglobales bacterium]
MGTPTPTPSAPPPRLITNQQGADRDPGAERDQRGHHDGTRAGPDVNHSRVVHRYVNHLRVCRLNYVDGLGSRLLHLYPLLGITAQCPGRICLCPQSLNRRGDSSLIRQKSLPDGGVVVDILRHHVQHLRK